MSVLCWKHFRWLAYVHMGGRVVSVSQPTPFIIRFCAEYPGAVWGVDSCSYRTPEPVVLLWSQSILHKRSSSFILTLNIFLFFIYSTGNIVDNILITIYGVRRVDLSAWSLCEIMCNYWVIYLKLILYPPVFKWQNPPDLKGRKLGCNFLVHFSISFSFWFWALDSN